MPILDLQRSVRQVGRIRLGELTATRSGKSAPTKLGTFRLSSPQRQPIDLAARLYGGTVTEMRSDRSDDRWQVTTTTSSIPVIIPPTSHLSQWYEEWSGTGCERRCDGQNMVVADGRAVDKPCECDPEDRACKMKTRLSLILPDLETLGVWRLDTGSYHAAVELAAAADLCAVATRSGVPIPARLDLEQRTKRGRDANGKPETKKFAVPVLSVDVSLPQAQAILGRVDGSTGEIARPQPAALQPPQPAALQPPADPDQQDSKYEASREAGRRAAQDPEFMGQLRQKAAELPPPPPADIPAPRSLADYQKAQEPPQEAVERHPAAGGMTDAQKYAASLPGNLTDDARHALYWLATGDPQARYTTLAPKHRNQVQRWARQIEACELNLKHYPSGVTLEGPDETIIMSVERKADADGDQEELAPQ